ncbi:unnamed protein product [Coccothraustes coccothraustes]
MEAGARRKLRSGGGDDDREGSGGGGHAWRGPGQRREPGVAAAAVACGVLWMWNKSSGGSLPIGIPDKAEHVSVIGVFIGKFNSIE